MVKVNGFIAENTKGFLAVLLPLLATGFEPGSHTLNLGSNLG
jgi:hypothetical protein